MRILPSSLIKYEMSDEELDRGSLLNSDNIAVIQNMIADISEQKLMLKFTPNDVLSFTQAEAEMMGQLLILRQLVDNSEEATHRIRLRFATQSSQSQSQQE